MRRLAVVFVLVAALFDHLCESGELTPPLLEKPLLLDSFLPASMQVIAHLTELMKYELTPAPPGGSTTPKPSTMRPTPSHKPGIYAPEKPPGPAVYYARGSTYEQYVQRLRNPPGDSYFDRYKYPVEDSWGRALDFAKWSKMVHERPADLSFLAPQPLEIIKQINRIDDYDIVDEDEHAQRFSENYDDSDFRYYLAAMKKIPPTRAYVTLLSVYDMINKEAKKLMLNKYGGYTDAVLKVLAETSTGTAEDQLKTIFHKIIERHDTKDPQIISKLQSLLTEMEKPANYISDAIRYLKPLQFAL